MVSFPRYGYLGPWEKFDNGLLNHYDHIVIAMYILRILCISMYILIAASSTILNKYRAGQFPSVQLPLSVGKFFLCSIRSTASRPAIASLAFVC